LGNNRDIMRIINKPKRYISKDTVEEAEKHGGDLLKEIMNQSNLNRLQLNRVFELKNDLKRLEVMKPQNAVKYIRNVIGYDEYLKEYAASKGISIKGLIETLEEIESSASSFRSIVLFMQHVEEVDEKLKEKEHVSFGRNNVKLLTMHKAKGLEFDTVFVCGSIEGLTPYIRDDTREEDFEEERRLFYVAMTRAKRELYITIPKHRYGKIVKPSRFVEEFRRNIDYCSQVRAGQRVYHKIYYTGVIQEVIGNMEGARIKVDFGGSVKELNLATCLKNEIIRLM
jgi:DNA helicase-2/ATP-dependent DNA helicase PcrA